MVDNEHFKLKFITGSIVVVFLMVIIGMKLLTEKSVFWVSIIFGISVIVFLGAMFGKKISEAVLTKNKEDLPEPITQEKAKENALKEIALMPNYPVEPIQPYSKTFNDNIIYAFKVPLEYEDVSEYGSSCWVILNATYPNLVSTIVKGSLSIEEIEEYMNAKSKKPENIEREITELTKDSFGNPVQKTIRENSHKIEKPEDLA